MRRKSQLIVALFSMMMMMTTHAYAQVNNYYASASGSGTACTQASPCTLQQSISSFTLGPNGATIHAAAGNYTSTVSCGGVTTNLCVSRSGTSNTQRLVIQCDPGVGSPFTAKGKCNLIAGGSGEKIVVMDQNGFNSIVGFDMTGPAADAAVWFGRSGDSNGKSFYLIGNYIHNIASSQPCELFGGLDSNGPAVQEEIKVLGNVFTDYNRPWTRAQCNTSHTIYLQGPGLTIENNLIGDAPKSGVTTHNGTCGVVISNNAFLGNGRTERGILPDNDTGTCTAGLMTIDNNYFVGQTGGIIGEGTVCTSSTPNFYGNNFSDGTQADFAAPKASCDTVSPSSFTHASPTSFFVNYVANLAAGTGDYHLKAGSPGIGAGTRNCTSGGITPCVPSNDIDGTNRPSGAAQDVGPYAFTSAGSPMVSFNPSSISFGTVAVSTSSSVQQSTLTNTGTASLIISTKTISGTNAGDFSSSDTCPSTLSSGASCLFSVTFTPQATGARSANVTVTDNGVGSPHQLPLSGTGGSSQLTVSPASLSFGVVAIGSCSAVQFGTFSNTGSVAVTLGSPTIGGTNPGDFAFAGIGTCGVGQTLQPGGSCANSIKFCPTAAGARSGTDSMPSNAANSPTVFSFTGTGGAPVVSLTPSSASCGSAQVGTSITCQIFTLQNTGNVNLTSIVVSLTGANPASYAQSNNCSATLAPAASCSITVFFQPVTASVQTANLSVASNASTSPNTAGLTGTGAPPPSISLVPATVNFGSVNVGTTSAPSTITITNTGGATATLSSIVASSGFAITSNTCGSTLAPNVSCQVSVIASPTSTGVTSGTLTVTDNAPGSPHVASLTVTGTAPAVALTPASNAYGNQAVGTATVPFNFTFTNSGTGPVSINSVGIVGANPSDFLISTNSCGASPTLSDTFSTGTLDSSKWVIDTGNSPAPGTGNTGTFSTANVFLNQSVLDLMLTQVAGSPIVSTGAEVRSLNTFGYGTYTWVARAGSTATTPSGSGSAVSGQVTGIFNYFQNNGLTAPNFTEDDFEVEGQFSTQLEMTSWSSASPKVNTSTNFTATGMDAGFHQYTYIWAPGRIDYYFDGALVSTHTTNVPSAPAFIIQNFYGTNGSSFGGTATTGVTRHLYVSSFSYTSTAATLGAGSSCTVGVTFKPIVSGARSATLQFIDNATGSPHTSTLTGTGTSLSISLSPASLTFSNTTVGTSSATQVVTLTNTGNITLNIASIVASGDYSNTTTCGATVTAGGTCTITVTFTPTATGTRTGAITITDNASGSPQTVPLTGVGTAPTFPVASISPSSLTFGNQVISTTSAAQTITLQNTGTATMNITSITASGDFARSTTCGATLATSASCTVSVTFTPTALGTRSGSITFVDDAAGSPQVIPLTGSGVSAPAPQVSVSPTSLTFASTTVGVTSAAQVLTLTNTGNATLNIASILASGDYARSTTCGATLAAGANCAVSVTFTPTATGTRSGSIAFTDDANGSPQSIPLTGTGTAPTAPLVSFSPTSLTFAGQTVGTTSTAQGLTLTNTGNATLSITSAVVSGDYAIGNTTCGSTLAASSSCVFNITFTPTATGTRSGALVSTDNASGSPHSVQFTGTGTAPLIPIAQISPTSLTFANQVVNTTSAAQTITLTNTGNGTLNITSIVASGDFARSTTCGSTLAPSVSCTVSVTFTPTAQGTRNGNIAFTDNASGSPQNATLTGTGVPAPQPAVTLSPTSLTFPSTFVGSTTAAQDITLTNSGTATLNIASIAASGDYAQTTTCGSTLAASSSCVIHVTFTPTAPGTRAGLISITDNAPGSPQTVGLSGVGIATSPAVCLSRTSINFGNQPVGSASSSMSATMTNCGTANLIVSGITVSGDYSQTNNCTTLTPGTTCTINGVFSPTVMGTRTGSFSIASNAASSPDVISLTGFGTQTGAAISPTSINFGSVIVGQSSASVPITVQNTGNTSLSLATPTISGANASDYSSGACFPTLAANASCSYLAVFSPSAPGSRTAILTQSITGIPSLTLALSGTGVTAASGVTTTPSSLDFGSVTVGVTSGSKTVQIQNSGNVVLNITSVTLTGTNAADYSLINHCGAALAVGGICTADLTATPSGTGARTANLHLIDDALTSPQDVPLTTNGVAVPAPMVSLAPTSLAFSPPNIQTGTTSQALTVTAKNTGNANLVVTHPVTLGGVDPGDYTVLDNCGTVTPGNSCTATVNCVPTVAGSRPATVIFTSNAPSSPDSATLACTGFVGTPTLTLAASTINFGNQTVGTTSGPAVFTLTNTGLATATGIVITATGDFAVSNTCGGSVAQGASCSASVTFTPAVLCGQTDLGGNCTSNVHLGQVSVVSNTSNSPQTVALQGTAVPAPPPPGPIIVGAGGKVGIGGKATVGVH